MRRTYFFLLLIFMTSFAFAQTSVQYYYGLDCPHCKVVSESGVLERLNQTVPVTKYETWYNVQNQEKFSAVLKSLGVQSSQAGVPFAVVNCSGKMTYLVGDTPIIQNVENYATTCAFEPAKPSSNSFWIWTIGIFAALAVFIWWTLKDTKNKK